MLTAAINAESTVGNMQSIPSPRSWITCPPPSTVSVDHSSSVRATTSRARSSPIATYNFVLPLMSANSTALFSWRSIGMGSAR